MSSVLIPPSMRTGDSAACSAGHRAGGNRLIRITDELAPGLGGLACPGAVEVRPAIGDKGRSGARVMSISRTSPAVPRR